MTRSRMPLIALAAAAGALVAALAVLSRPEAMIGAGFQQALAGARPADQGRGAQAAPRLAQVPTLDPRHLRPSSLTVTDPDLPVLGPLKVGEKVKVAAAGGTQVLEVIGVHELSRDALGPAGDAALVLVTLRADDEARSIVRWLVEKPAEQMLPADPGRRAL